MAAWGTIDGLQLDGFAKQVSVLINSSKVETALNKTIAQAGNQFITEVQKRTPSEERAVRNNWKLQGPVVSMSNLTLTIMNNAAKASDVETGYRPDDGSGWVEGAFMMAKTANDFERQLPKMLSTAFLTHLQELMQ